MCLCLLRTRLAYVIDTFISIDENMLSSSLDSSLSMSTAVLVLYSISSEVASMVYSFVCDLFKNSRIEQANLMPPSGIENR